jgi:hypothetical protein
LQGVTGSAQKILTFSTRIEKMLPTITTPAVMKRKSEMVAFGFTFSLYSVKRPAGTSSSHDCKIHYYSDHWDTTCLCYIDRIMVYLPLYGHPSAVGAIHACCRDLRPKSMTPVNIVICPIAARK